MKHLIKRKILLENSIDRNYNSPTYGSLTATSFFLKVMLTQSMDDMGIFTDIEYIPSISGLTEVDFYDYGNMLVTGFTDSKLQELRSYDANDPFQVNFDINSETYVNYSGQTINGVDRVTLLGSATTYVFGTDSGDTQIGTVGQKSGILYQDFSGRTRSVGSDNINETIVSYIGEGWNQTNTSLSGLTKEEYLFGIISPPEIESDVFIDRSSISVIEKHLKLSEIRTLDELVRYGNGFYTLNKE